MIIKPEEKHVISQPVILESPVMYFHLLSHGAASDYSAVIAGARVAAQHLYHKLHGSPGPGEMMQYWNVMLLPPFISLCCFFPFMSFVDNGEALAPKVLDDFFPPFFFYFPLSWRQNIDFYPTCSIFTLQAFGQQIQELLPRNVPLFSVWGHFYTTIIFKSFIKKKKEKRKNNAM